MTPRRARTAQSASRLAGRVDSVLRWLAALDLSPGPDAELAARAAIELNAAHRRLAIMAAADVESEVLLERLGVAIGDVRAARRGKQAATARLVAARAGALCWEVTMRAAEYRLWTDERGRQIGALNPFATKMRLAVERWRVVVSEAASCS